MKPKTAISLHEYILLGSIPAVFLVNYAVYLITHEMQRRSGPSRSSASCGGNAWAAPVL
jgi:hypothetical protein